MDTKIIDIAGSDPVLVNFRAPRAMIDLLDRASRFDNRTRTAVLLDLITHWIAEKSKDIPQRVRATKDLKDALKTHEDFAFDNRLRVELIQAEITNRNESNRIVMPIFPGSSVDFDDEDGRF